MMRIFGGQRRRPLSWLVVAGALMTAGPGAAQMQSIDPDTGFDRAFPAASSLPPVPPPAPPPAGAPYAPNEQAQLPPLPPQTAAPGFDLADPTAPAQVNPTTYRKDELVAASETAFGQSARDVAAAIGDILQKQGEPNGYIVGTEGGGAFIFGLRYGSGTLYQKTHEARPVYWSGPSLGFDAGMAAGDTFVLVYNLDDQEDLFSRFGSGEGQAYIVGGLHVSYLRKDNVVLIPVRMGVGLRLGLNAGYMKFSRKQNMMPF